MVAISTELLITMRTLFEIIAVGTHIICITFITSYNVSITLPTELVLATEAYMEIISAWYFTTPLAQIIGFSFAHG